MTDDADLIRQRIRRWHHTGDLGALWPEFTASERKAGHAEVLAVTQMLLRPPTARPSLQAETERECAALGISAFASGMGPQLGWWIERGLVDASSAAQQVLAVHLDHSRRRIALLRAALAPIVSALRTAGITPIVLKGLHTGAVYFPEPGTRPMADIDILVHPSEREGTATALRHAGLQEARRTAFAARSEWVTPNGPQQVRSLEFDHVDNPWHVDLHAALERWYFRGLRAGFGEEAFACTEPLTLGSDAVRVLRQPLLTAFLALHACCEPARVRLIRLFELVLMIRRDTASGALESSELAALLERTGTARFAYPALILAEQLCAGTVDPTLLAQGEATLSSRMRRVIDAVEAGGMAPLAFRSLDDRLAWAQGVRQTALNLSELLWPSDEGLEVGIAQLYRRRWQALVRGAVGVRAR